MAGTSPDPRITVLIANHELAEREKLKSYLARENDIQVIGEAADGRECLELVTRTRPNVVLIKEDLPVVNGLTASEQITADVPGVGIILILTGAGNEDSWRRILQAGVRDFLTCPVTAERLLEGIRKVAALQSKVVRRMEETGPAPVVELVRHQVITVTGPRGGCGKTVIATNLAVAMVRQDTKTALIDLNLWGGDVAMLLDVAPSRTLGDLLPGFGGIDRDVVESVISKHSSGVAVVASPVTGTFDQAALSRVIVADILKVVREQYSYTLVDSGHPNLESTLAAMDYSDLVVVVIGSDMPRLRDAKLYLRNLLIASYPKEKLRVVINRTAAAKLVSVGEMESILEFPIATEIPNDDELVSASVNLGQPVVLSAPHKPVAKALISLAESLAPQAAPANHRKRGIHWFHNLLVQMMP